jgi:hypothetical protein
MYIYHSTSKVIALMPTFLPLLLLLLLEPLLLPLTFNRTTALTLAFQ